MTLFCHAAATAQRCTTPPAAIVRIWRMLHLPNGSSCIANTSSVQLSLWSLNVGAWLNKSFLPHCYWSLGLIIYDSQLALYMPLSLLLSKAFLPAAAAAAFRLFSYWHNMSSGRLSLASCTGSHTYKSCTETCMQHATACCEGGADATSTSYLHEVWFIWTLFRGLVLQSSVEFHNKGIFNINYYFTYFLSYKSLTPHLVWAHAKAGSK